MQNLEALSWNQLVEELRELTEHNSPRDPKDDPRIALHNLFVHQVELEMQNRELRDAQQRLEASRARYADLYDFAPVGCLTIDPDERIQEINLTGAALLGRDRADIIGRPFVGVVPLGGNAMVFHEHLRRCTDERCRVDTEIEFVPKGRAPVLLLMTSAPLFDTNGQATGCRTALTDVTDRRRAEDAEADARMKEEFLGTVSHELRTPLTAIVGWVGLLQDRHGSGVDRDMLHHGLEVIERNAMAQGRLIEDILDCSRILAGKLRVDLQRTDLNPLIRESVESMLPAAQGKGIVLSATIAPRAIVLGDVERLRQVVANLLTNAVKFTPAGGTIDVSVVADTDFVRIAVSDSGRGIATPDLPHVFERFKQVDSSTTRTASGLGLGLAIVDHIVRAHGGDVAATSAGSGFGATFVVRLRRMRGSDENEPTPIRSQKREEGSLEGCEILCVDNDIDALEVTAIILRQGGALVSTAQSAAEALAVLASSTPDVVLSDIGLPSEDGYELLRQIRKLPGEAARAPAIALTAYADEASAKLAREAGFQLFLSKPIAPEDLVRAIAQVTGRSV